MTSVFSTSLNKTNIGITQLEIDTNDMFNATTANVTNITDYETKSKTSKDKGMVVLHLIVPVIFLGIMVHGACTKPVHCKNSTY